MTSEEFVDAIRSVVVDSAADDMISTLVKPPGRSPAPELLELSRWYRSLPTEDQVMVRRLLDMVARDTVHALFAVLDGSLQIEPFGPKGHLELRHFSVNGEVSVLSGPEGDALHELL